MAKPNFLIEEKREDGAWLKRMIAITAIKLPEPKSKKNKK